MTPRRTRPLAPLTALGVSAVLLTGLAAGPAQAQEDAPLGTVTQTADAVVERALSNAKTQREDVAADPAAEIVLSGTIALKDIDEAHPAPAGAAYRLRVENGAGTEIRTIATEAAFSLTLPGGEAYYLLASVDGDDSWYPTWFGDTPIAVEADGIGESRTDVAISLPRATTVSGSVTAAAVAGVSATSFVVQPYWYEREDNAYYPFTEVATSGNPGRPDAWTTAPNALPAGEWIFRLAEPGYPVYDDEYYRELPRLDERAITTVPAAGRTGVDFTPTAYASNTGTRIEGTDRYGTAVAVTRKYFGDDIPVLYIASGANWPDALSAGPAASVQDGALLLTDPDQLFPVVSAEIQRLSPQRIVVVGSSLSVSDAVYEQIAALGSPTERISGSDRYETSRKIVADAFPAGSYDTVFLPTGGAFPDALSVAPIAGRLDQPVLLVDGAKPALDAPTREALARLDAADGLLLGGTDRISTGVEADLRGSGLTGGVNRLAGIDRHDTSRKLNAAYAPSPLVDTAFLASAIGFADALAVGPAAASIGAPLYLSQPDCVYTATRRSLQDQDLDQITLLGGTGTLSADVARLTAC
ncbi:cell wall-binding repeat-containing protein [Rathayibacter sp. VKM Ac-2927]|uniref:cell wall-binding repeat-containing protein n=1 Tax=Rathayibacter sp. VKM Ac-2927 TaxID=2929478 RepID=UPI001FB49012|nr:cell wall-binding repeat-containing protein [Rathayibacter sp. VKM Ac-2927]MCJ1687088.1 cell wall-binding repeat-containing protein [Rathayibacter sp. VKM Ac-2927]